MICLTIMLLSGLAGVISLFSGAIVPGLGFFCVALVFFYLQELEFKADDEKRRTIRCAQIWNEPLQR